MEKSKYYGARHVLPLHLLGQYTVAAVAGSRGDS